MEKYGLDYKVPKGYILEIGEGNYNHFFGGSTWSISELEGVKYDPCQVITLDLKDPSLDFISKKLIEIPLITYLNCSINEDIQVYSIDKDNRSISFEKNKVDEIYLLDVEDRLPFPLPECSLHLRDMDETEYPIDEDSYWDICDTFLGGESFFRVGGKPLWLDEVEDVKCTCGQKPTFVAQIGYELYDTFSLIPDKTFYVGENGFYFFYCDDCQKVTVISQSS